MTKPLILNKPVIAITGSAGKTTTKEMIAAILQQRWNILKTSGNANAPRHTAMYAKKVKPYHKALVLEFGMSRHGEIRRSSNTIQPNIGIITNVGTAHIGNFNGDIKGIANTKSDLIRNMKQTGLLVLNADDGNSKLLDISKFKGKILTVSQINESDLKAENIRYHNRGMLFNVIIDKKKHELYIPVYGKHNIYNALYAIAVANHLGFTIKEIKTGLQNFKKLWGRLSSYGFRNGLTLIDDSFSANPNAVKAAIDVISIIGKGRKVVVLGTMLEMGKYKVKGHKDVGKYLSKKNIDMLYTYGNDAQYIARGAIEAGFPKNNVKTYENPNLLYKDLIKELRPNTIILFKASHGMYLNRIIKSLVEYYREKNKNKNK